MKRGAKETTELVVLRKSPTKPNAYEFIEGNTTRRDLRLIKLGNWLFVEADCGSYYCAWRYTNDDGVITLYSVDGSREADSRTMDFLRSLKIEGHSTTAEELTKDFNSLWTLGGSDLRDSPSPSHQPSSPPPSKVDVPSAAAGSDMPQVIGEIPTLSRLHIQLWKLVTFKRHFANMGIPSTGCTQNCVKLTDLRIK